jgi:hypothetical protein
MPAHLHIYYSTAFQLFLTMSSASLARLAALPNNKNALSSSAYTLLTGLRMGQDRHCRLLANTRAMKEMDYEPAAQTSGDPGATRREDQTREVQQTER